MKTIHIILNSHIDPIWLWPWQAGVDAALATCRGACDRLDDHHDIYFNRGEAWIYRQIELLDPPLFKRIRKHVDAGRWAIVGGWWIQPDCNLPSGFAMRKQIELGQKYFTKTFGRSPITAYNVDSFGHSAALPGMMRDLGQTRYVMMRPQEHELNLPARLFRWRGREGGPEVLTFRIAEAYSTWTPQVPEHVLASTTHLPAGVDHTMCFIGIGDHGGGPSEEQIQYLMQHRDALPGWRLQFSTVDRFFDAVTAQLESGLESLPLVTGELQHHAVGCYTTQRAVKTAVRRAEHLLAQAEIITHSGTRPIAGTAAKMQAAWEDVCLHHFHDTLGGTCIPSAYRQVIDQLGRAAASADELLHYTFRRKLARLKPHPMQRMALFNASEAPFDSYLTVSPWMEGRNLSASAVILDEQDQPMPHQLVSSDALVRGSEAASSIIRLSLPAKTLAIFRIDPANQKPRKTAGPSTPADATVDGFILRAGVGAGEIGCGEMLRFGEATLALPHLELLDDVSDTWGHGVSRYADTPVNVAKFGAAVITARGPLMAAKIIEGQIGSSRVRAEWRVHRDDPMIELRLMIVFVGRHKMLKLVLPLPATEAATLLEPPAQRIDGIMDGSLLRANDGIERPLRDWTLLKWSDGRKLAVIAPDCFALDCNGRSLRFSLVRSPLMAHHIPQPASRSRGIHADQGRHEFRFWFGYGEAFTSDHLEARALWAHQPPLFADLTKGMKSG